MGRIGIKSAAGLLVKRENSAADMKLNSDVALCKYCYGASIEADPEANISSSLAVY